GRRQLSGRTVRADVPRLIAVHLGILLLPSERWLGETELFTRRALVVIDRAGEAGEVPTRPLLSGDERLSEKGVHAGPGILNRVHAAHCLLSVLQDAGRCFRTTASSQCQSHAGE